MGSIYFTVVLVLVLSVALESHCQSETFDTIISPGTTCQDSCNATNDVKTADEVKACDRGCRFYRLTEWSSMLSDESAVLAQCNDACNEAYANAPYNVSCQTGCGAGVPIIKPKPDELSLLKTPDTMMEQFMQQALQSFGIMSSLMQPAYLSSQGGTAEVYEIVNGNDHEIVVVEYRGQESAVSPRSEKVRVVGEELKTTLGGNHPLETNLQTESHVSRLSDRWPSIFAIGDELPKYAYGRNDLPKFAYIDGELPRYSGGEYLGPRSDTVWTSLTGNASKWWDCFTRKSGLPELVLFGFWISVMLLLTMTCCVQFNSRRPKLSVNGDLALIRDKEGNLPSFIKTPLGGYGEKSAFYMASVVQAPPPAYEEKVALI